MADETPKAAEAAADKPKITLIFTKPHTHHFASKPNKDGALESVTKTYKPGDRDIFTQADADLIRKLGVAQTLANP